MSRCPTLKTHPLVTLALAGLLAACGGSEDSAPGGDPGQTTDPGETTDPGQTTDPGGTSEGTYPVGGKGPLKVLAFTVEPETVTFGSEATLRWAVQGPEVVLINFKTDGHNIAGSTERNYQRKTGALFKDTVFQLVARGGEDTQMKELTVKVTPAPLKITSFTATPNPAAAGAQVKLEWAMTGAHSFTLTEGGKTIAERTSENFLSGGGANVTMGSADTTYTLTISNGTDPEVEQALTVKLK